jgi:hypothetical protein
VDTAAPGGSGTLIAPPLVPATAKPRQWTWALVAVPAVCLFALVAAGAAGAFLLPLRGRATASPTPGLGTSTAVEAVEASATVLPATATIIALTSPATVTPLPFVTDTPAPTATRQPGAPNQMPTAADDTAQTVEDQAVLINVLQNDRDPEGRLAADSLAVVIQPQHGQATPAGAGIFNYTPAANYSGTDTFSYQICDTAGQCAQAVVTVSIAPGNDPPAAVADSFTLNANTNVTLPAPGVLANDTDPDGDTLTVTGSTPAGNASVTVAPNGEVTVRPAPDFCGADSFSYTISDGKGGTATAQVALDVTCLAFPKPIDVQLLGANPASGATLPRGSTVNVRWSTAFNNYDSTFVFTRVEFVVYNNAQCTGQPSTWEWGEAAYWSRSRASGATGENNIDLTVSPSITHWGTVYLAVRVSVYAQDPPGQAATGGSGPINVNVGALIDSDEAYCYVAPEV